VSDQGPAVDGALDEVALLQVEQGVAEPLIVDVQRFAEGGPGQRALPLGERLPDGVGERGVRPLLVVTVGGGNLEVRPGTLRSGDESKDDRVGRWRAAVLEGQGELPALAQEPRSRDRCVALESAQAKRSEDPRRA